MYVKEIILKNFRNYEYTALELSEEINVFSGDNAQGKTNILESIFFSSIGKSHRTSKDKEMIQWSKEFLDIQINLQKIRLDKSINIKISKSGKKAISINRVHIKKTSELIGICNVVMFSPEDLKIVKESPAHRRKFLDIEISKLNQKYYYNLIQYNKVLSERNKILKDYHLNRNLLDFIDVYDMQLSKFSALIAMERVKYLEKLNEYSLEIHKDITTGKENIRFKYITDVNNLDNYEGEILSKLRENRDKDILRRSTSVGPHRDDFSIKINEIDTKTYGSQGQQRTAILTMKFASLKIIKDIIGEYPVLLLDDVLSELDASRQRYILSSIQGVQTIITCTGIQKIRNYLGDKFKLFTVCNGEIKDTIEG